MQEIIITVLATAFALALFGLLIYFFYRQKNPKPAKGTAGDRHNKEGRAVAAMRGFARSNRFRLIAPAHLTRGEATADLSAIVVGYFGVLGVIALGYGGEVYGSADEETWVHVTTDGERIRFQNPVTEASAAVRVIRESLFASNQKRVPVEVVYVFTEQKTQLALPRSLAPMRMKEFKKLLKKDKYLDDSGLDMDKVENAIRAAITPDA